MGSMSIMGIIATLHHHGYHMGIMGIIIIEITIISATLHDCQTDQVPSVQDDMIVQRKDVEFHVYSHRALPVLPPLPFPSFPGDRWGGVVVLVVGAAGSPTLHGFPLCSSLSSSLATAKNNVTIINNNVDIMIQRWDRWGAIRRFMFWSAVQKVPAGVSSSLTCQHC